MSASVHAGPTRREVTRDREGHREYKVTHTVKTTSVNDGPYIVMHTPGLPAIGSKWNFGNDDDVWAFCYPDMQVRELDNRDQSNTRYWRVEQIFSTKPLNRCQDETIEDPLLEPQKVSGTFVKYTEEAAEDKDGKAIMSSSHEMFHGPQVEFDKNRPTVRIEQNVGALELALFSEMVDTLNDDTLWGLEARKIKLSNVSWERLFYGTCDIYYKRVFDFDIDFSTFDRNIPDEGTKVLSGDWDRETGKWVLRPIPGYSGIPDPNPQNPSHFVRYKDINGENARVLLDGDGLPADEIVLRSEDTGTGTAPGDIPTEAGAAARILVQKYEESNFLLLGIPTSF